MFSRVSELSFFYLSRCNLRICRAFLDSLSSFAFCAFATIIPIFYNTYSVIIINTSIYFRRSLFSFIGFSLFSTTNTVLSIVNTSVHFSLLSLFEWCNIPVLNWHDPPTLNFPRDIKARVGLPLAKDTPNYVNEMHAKFVQIVAIACQWPEATLTDLNILRNILKGKCSRVRYVTQWMIEKKVDFYPC